MNTRHLVRLAPAARLLTTIVLLASLASCGGGYGGGGGGGGGGCGYGGCIYTIGGTITGLTTAGLVLSDGGMNVSPAANATSFTFPTAVATGTMYNVTVMTQPMSATCKVTAGSGSVGATNITTVVVTCTATMAMMHAYMHGQVFAHDPRSGALSAGAATPGCCRGAVADDAGRFVFAPAEGGGGLNAFRRDPATGALTLVSGSPYDAAARVTSLAAERSGRFVYATDAANDLVWGYAINTDGSLAALPGSPWATGRTPATMVVDRSGALAYVAARDGTVSAFRIEPETGALIAAPGSPFTAAEASAGAAGAAAALAPERSSELLIVRSSP